MSMHLQVHNYFWYFVLFHFVHFLRRSHKHTHVGIPLDICRRPAWEHLFKSYIIVLCWFLFYFIIFCLIWKAHKGICLWACVGCQSIDRRQVLLILVRPRMCGHRFQIAWSLLSFVLFCFWHAHKLMRRHLRIRTNPTFIFYICQSRITRVLFWLV